MEIHTKVQHKVLLKTGVMDVFFSAVLFGETVEMTGLSGSVSLPTSSSPGTSTLSMGINSAVSSSSSFSSSKACKRIKIHN